MLRSFSKSVLLLLLAVVLTCGAYPAILWCIGQSVFPFQANGSIIRDKTGKAVGSLLVAQPFTKDEYFQPRPSAASYDGTASSASTLAVSNYKLRDRVARQIGPLATYGAGPKNGQSVASDLEAWFRADQAGGKPGIVAQWADAHNGLAQGWAAADPSHAAYVDAWSKDHPDIVAQFVKGNPGTPRPQAADLAVTFFEHFSADHPGRFPVAVTRTRSDGKSETAIEPAGEGTDIQAMFFDMWRQDHPDAPLRDLPADLVTASGSGLDPHITLENAEYQLGRVAVAWARDLKRDPAQMRGEIDAMLHARAFSPGDGLFGEPIVNVLQINLDLTNRYGPPRVASR